MERKCLATGVALLLLVGGMLWMCDQGVINYSYLRQLTLTVNCICRTAARFCYAGRCPRPWPPEGQMVYVGIRDCRYIYWTVQPILVGVGDGVSLGPIRC